MWGEVMMDKFFNGKTTFSKGIKVLVWAGFSAVVVAVLSGVTNNPDLFSPQWVVVANVLLVAVKNFIDPKVKNI